MNDNHSIMCGKLAEKLLVENIDLVKNWDNSSESFKAFQLLIETILEKEQNINSQEIIDKYGEQIKQIMEPFLEGEGKDKKAVIEQILSEEFTEAGSSFLYHKLREAISLNQFIPHSGIPTVEIIFGKQKHIAEIHTHTEDQFVLANAEFDQWETLMAQAITSMDDLTADAFDVISILWMKSAKSEVDMISFSHEDVITMRQLQKKKNSAGYESFRKKDRDEVMKRLAALASIWIRVDEDDEVHFVEQKSISDYKKSKLKRLFMVDNVTIAQDRKTEEFIGIDSCDIRPGDLLAGYLHGAKKTTGFLSLKALQYNPVLHKHHKRLTRYLSWQWRIRSRKSDFERPYTIGGEKGLLNVMGLELNEDRPMRTKESFEGVLDTLQTDGIVQSWQYVEIDEGRVGKGNPKWLTSYWMHLQVIIIPPSEVIKGLKQDSKVLSIEEVITAFGEKIEKKIEKDEQLLLFKEEESTDIAENLIDISPENVKHVRESRGLSLSKAAKEIGMAHTTLSRYEKKEITKPNSKNDEKLKKWIEEYDI